MKWISIKASPVFHLMYPHTCVGCGSDNIDPNNFLCLACIEELPHTGYAMHANNPVEKIFWGRIEIKSAMSEFYFSKSSIVQNLIHEFKYKGNKQLGNFLGNYIGRSLLNSNRFKDIDCIVPMPLFEKKEKMRGFNQAEILCTGISEIINVPVNTKNVIRKIATETQTKKGRTERWENVSKTFSISHPENLEGKYVLLVDDVVTTGATLEACASELVKLTGTNVSLATLALASK